MEQRSEHIKQVKLREQQQQQNPNSNTTAPNAANTQRNASAATPLQIPGLVYHEINFNGGAFEKSLFYTLSGWNRTYASVFRPSSNSS